MGMPGVAAGLPTTPTPAAVQATVPAADPAVAPAAAPAVVPVAVQVAEDPAAAQVAAGPVEVDPVAAQAPVAGPVEADPAAVLAEAELRAVGLAVVPVAGPRAMVAIRPGVARETQMPPEMEAKAPRLPRVVPLAVSTCLRPWPREWAEQALRHRGLALRSGLPWKRCSPGERCRWSRSCRTLR